MTHTSIILISKPDTYINHKKNDTYDIDTKILNRILEKQI